MRVNKVKIKNFRLLKDATLCLEERTTVIVGRNNSGKTSLTEIFRRFLIDPSPTFYIEDFCLEAHEEFWGAFHNFHKGYDEHSLRQQLPAIEMEVTMTYDAEDTDLGLLSELIIDLDDQSTQAKAVCYC